LLKNKFSGNWFLILGILLLALIYSYLFKFTGARFIITLAIFMLPSYLILSLFNLEIYERIIFSFFTSLALISSSVYWLSFITNSIKLAFIIIILIILIFAVIINLIKNKKLFFQEKKHSD